MSEQEFFEYVEGLRHNEICRLPGWCVMGASMHLSHECCHVDDAAHYYEMIESEFSSTEEIGGEA